MTACFDMLRGRQCTSVHLKIIENKFDKVEIILCKYCLKLQYSLLLIMADHCSFCDTRRPSGGTNTLILGGDWLEFCQPCGDKETLRNAHTGEVKTLREVLDLCIAEEEG